MADDVKERVRKELLRRKVAAEITRRKTPQAENSIGGSLQAAGSGLAEGGISLAGMAGDAQQMTGDIAAWGMGKMGMPQNWQDNARTIAQTLAVPGLQQMPRTGQIRSAAIEATRPSQTTAGLVTGEQPKSFLEYEPQTTAEGYIKKVGEFAPATVAGPGGLLRKTAMTALPAIASEFAENSTSNETLKPYAGSGAALLTAVAAPAAATKTLQKLAPKLAAKLGFADPLKAMRENAPSYDEVKGATDEAYKMLRDAGIQYSGNAYKSFAMKAAHELRNRGWRPRDGDVIGSDIKEILSRMNKPNDYAEMESLRRSLGNLPTNASKADRGHAAFLKKKLDEFMDNADNVTSSKNIPKEDISRLYKMSREMASRKIKADQINTMNENRAGYLGGDESAMRNQFGSYLRNPSKRSGLSPAEKSAFGKVVRREGVEGAAHTMGSRMGQIVGGGSSSAIGAMLGGSILPGVGHAVGAVAGPVVNYAGTSIMRSIMEKVTDKKVREALQTVLAGKKAQTAAFTASQKAQLSARVQEAIALMNAARAGDVPAALPAGR